MKTTHIRSFLLVMLLFHFGSVRVDLFAGQRMQTAPPQAQTSLVKRQVEMLKDNDRVRIQLKSKERITGRLLERGEHSLFLESGKNGDSVRREISYNDIKSIRLDEKLSPGIKVLSVVVTLTIVAAFALLTHHRN